MKKIGIIALALITLLATLGIGFSMWSQTITINGQVNTGNVTLQVSGFSGTWAYKDSTGALQFITAGQPTGWPNSISPTPDWVGASAVVSSVAVGGGSAQPVDYTNSNQTFACTSNGGLTLNLTYSNLFPVPDGQGGFKYWIADFDLTNTGSIPVKLEITSTATTNLTGTPGTMPIQVWYSATGLINPAEGYQLEPNAKIHVEIPIQVQETTNQSYSGSFSLQISGVQWNEYAAPGATNTSVPR